MGVYRGQPAVCLARMKARDVHFVEQLVWVCICALDSSLPCSYVLAACSQAPCALLYGRRRLHPVAGAIYLYVRV